MAEVSADDRKQAEYVVGKLFAARDEGRRESYLEPMDIFLADVEAAFDRYLLLDRFCRDEGIPFPSLPTRGGEGVPIPIDWSFLWPFWPEPFRVFSPRRFWSDFFGYPWTPWSEPFGPVEPSKPDEAAGHLRKRLQGFLETRFSARQSNISQSPGLKLKVVTQTHGKRVHKSPAYFFNPNLYFAAPTTPVVGWIQPGRYIFGVQGPRDPQPLFDSAEFDIPPTTSARLNV
jgi:hypothetical protein